MMDYCTFLLAQIWLLYCLVIKLQIAFNIYQKGENKMSIPRTPSTSDYSTLETKERNDNTTLKNTTPATPARGLPDPTSSDEFEVETGTSSTEKDGQNTGKNKNTVDDTD